MGSLSETLRMITGDSDDEFLGFEPSSGAQRVMSDSDESISSVRDFSSVSSSDSDCDPDGDFDIRPLSAGDADDIQRTTSRDFSSAYHHPWLRNFEEPTGALAHSAESSEYDIYSYFLSPSLIDMVVAETNRYAAQYLATAVLRPKARAKRWKDLSAADVKAFLALLLLQSIVKMPTYESYWSTEFYMEVPGLRSIMPRDKFELILQFLDLSDNTTDLPSDHPDHDRLHKVRPLLSELVCRWKAAYHPQREVSVDESIVAFKGRSKMIVYKPNKPHKWGLNAWVLAEAKTGYVWNLEMYTGKKSETEVGLTKKVVTSLCQPLYNTGHHVYMDNYFSSPALFCELKQNQLGACGTLRTNRTGVPASIKTAKLTKKKCGTVIDRDADDMLYIAWFDKRQVTVMSSVHNTQTFEKTVRTRNAADHRRTVQKPLAIELYSRYMQGVDRADQLLWYKLSTHRQLKWWKKLFLYLLEVTTVNACTIYRHLHPDKSVCATKFRLAVVSGLLEGYDCTSVRFARRPANPPPSRLVGRHFPSCNLQLTPAGRPTKPDCIVCSDRDVKRHQTPTLCRECKVPLCAVPCFERYHTLLDYKAICSDAYHKC